jgi:glycosyltransferase involved in cell wall biosynthesis
MKPYLLVSGDFVTTGGMDRANHALALHLANRGNEVHLVAHRVDETLESHPCVKWHYVPKPANSYLLGAPLLDRVGRFWANRIRARGGRVLVNGGNCLWSDVNWVHYVHAAYAPDEAAGGRLRQMKSRIARRRFLSEEKRALSDARLIFANSYRTKQDLVDLLDIPAGRVHTVYYGTDTATFRPAKLNERATVRKSLELSQYKPIVMFIGALGDRRKGFDTLFNAWHRLWGEGSWDADLLVAGAGAELPAWQRRAENAGMASSIRFLGFRNDIPDILRACDALVAPTRYEAYGLGVHEALCCGLPVLVSKSSGVAERCPGELSETLLIQNPDDPVELAKRLKNWRAGAEQYRNAVQPLTNSLRSHDWDAMASEMVGIMESMN